jgi:putative ABC transport system substrate-binding protein
MTGMTNIAVDLAAKRLEMLSELSPHISRLGVLYFTAYPGVVLQLDELQRAATALKKSLFPIEAGRLDELPGAFEKIVALATSSRLWSIIHTRCDGRVSII